MARQDAQLAKNVVLALIVEQSRHGWALHEELSSTGDIGRAWRLSRQLVYRAIDTLEDEGLVRRATPKDGRGADKVIISATTRGKSHVSAWLDEPVAHLRDVRTELVVKVMLRQRAGLPMGSFIARQRRQFETLFTAIDRISADNPVDAWRRESASAVKRYLARLEKMQRRQPPR